MKYRRRIPKELVPYVSKNEIKKVVRSESEALVIDMKIDNALKIVKGNFTNATKTNLIKGELAGYIEVRAEETLFRYLDAVDLYLKQSQVSETEKKNREYFFTKLLPSLLKYVYKSNPVTSEITSSHLNEIASIMQKLPSRNHQNLKRVSTDDIIAKSVKGEYDNIRKLHIDTINKHIKRIRSLALFGFSTGQFKMTTAIATLKHKYSAREQRKALTCDEIETIYCATDNDEVKSFITLLRYTGMRLGELCKYKVNVIDGVECFDLREAESLKTMSSFRIIPKHPNIKSLEFTYSFEHLSRLVKQLINKKLDDSERKTTYSLRHTFATELVQRG